MEDKEWLENERSLVERAKKDEQAFALLYQHYFPKIYGYIFKRLGNREASEDILSTTFLKVFANLKKYQSRGFSFGAWLYRVATNNLMDYYRRNKFGAETELAEADGAASSSESPAEATAKKQERAEIEKVLNKMPERYREIIQLRYFAELEIYEIAATLKISKVHASVLIHRALKCFKDKYHE
jgi:RNA polymerase sigma-70 factor (ECF subfamily)